LIFEANPQQIKDLDSKELVQLMHRLLLAESRLARIPLRSSHTALQITISDGGEDGRVEWEGGVESTPYLPSRYSIFQSKAQNLTEAAIRKEIIKKGAKPKKSKSNKVKKKATKRIARRSVILSEASLAGDELASAHGHLSLTATSAV
jgi:hypothetical protein